MKKDGITQRKILQCMSWNCLAVTVDEFMGESVDYGLLGLAAIAQVETRDDSIDVVSLDAGNAFTYVEIIPEWWPLLSGPRIRARHLPKAWTRGRWPGSTWLRPQHRRLPMGNTHAAFILLQILRWSMRAALEAERFFARVFDLNGSADRATRTILDAFTVAF